ncbi:MvdC/MvdD family ATP grasp protein [Roseateles chitinivorans]|uniref:MvdC/MvdD family ATP grasp protein n=1 Tax=Roseateles chitinivorans TaxID=2917965 RepID=UPI003D66F85C
MSEVLIMTLAHDIHAHCVASALESRGHIVKRWIGDRFPSAQSTSLWLCQDSDPYGVVREGQESIGLSESVDVVWLRRPRWPVTPDKLLPEDKEPAAFELKEWYRSLCGSSWQSARWVNSIAGRRAANNKILQLKLARQVGLIIPSTLVSNEPAEVRRFVSGARTVVKPFYTQSWQEQDGLFHSFTAAIDLDRLPADEYIAACPAIYQREVVKHFEVRAFFCGNSVQSIALHSQDNKESASDWRTVDPALLSPHPIKMPNSVQNSCLRLMKSLGIVTGSFDFAVTKSGEWVFFEVNEQGQFLWMEEVSPETTVLDMFVNFIESPDPEGFCYIQKSGMHRFAETLRSARVKELAEQDAMGALGGIPLAML